MTAHQRYVPVMYDWSQIKSSAPGRFILVGEFAEMYEKNAIAFAIDCRTTVTIKKHREGRLRLNLKNYNDIREWPTTSFTMTKLVAKYADVLEYTDTIPLKLNHLLDKRYYQINTSTAATTSNTTMTTSTTTMAEEHDHNDKIQQADNGVMAFLILYVALADSYAWSSRPALDVEIETDIPIGRGLGSSTAYAAALCEALMKVFRVSAEPYFVSNWSLAIEQFFHGSASSLSISVVVQGGYIYYQNSKTKYIGIPHQSQINVMFIDTLLKINSRQIVKSLREKLSQQPDQVNAIFNSIHELASLAWRKINDPAFSPKTIRSLLTTNQDHLDNLELSNHKIKGICQRATIFKLPVKQTQCGEQAFALYDDTINDCSKIADLDKLLAKLGHICRHYKVSYDGLSIEVAF